MLVDASYDFHTLETEDLSELCIESAAPHTHSGKVFTQVQFKRRTADPTSSATKTGIAIDNGFSSIALQQPFSAVLGSDSKMCNITSSCSK